MWASLVAQLVKNLPAMWETWFNPWVGKIPWRRERLPTPVFWPGEFHGLYSVGHKESDTTERLNNRKLSLSCPPFLSEAVSEVKWNEMKWKSLSHVWLFVTPWLHAILQARILEWVAFPFSKGSSQPRDWTRVSLIADGFLTSWATMEAQCIELK